MRILDEKKIIEKKFGNSLGHYFKFLANENLCSFSKFNCYTSILLNFFFVLGDYKLPKLEN